MAQEQVLVNTRRLLGSYLREASEGAILRGGTCEGTRKGNLLLDPLLQELQARGEYVQTFAEDVGAGL